MRKKFIVVFMTICLLLTGCQVNVKETEQKENRQETADITQAEIECEYTWATSHCTYRIETSSQVHVPENSDEEYELFAQECLVQSDYQGKVLQKIPADQMGLSNGEDITFLHVSENEVLICWNSYTEDESKAHIYSVPIIWKDGSEEIAADKKQLLFERDSEFAPKYIMDTEKCILLNFDNKLTEYDRKSNKITQIKYENKPLKFSHILYENNKDSFVFFAVQRRKSAAYHYSCETKEVQEIIKDERSMLYQGGENKLFYTAVKEENGSLCYDVYQYDCKSGKKSVLVTEEQIRNALSEKPEKEEDLIREMAFEDGKLKLEINVKGEENLTWGFENAIIFADKSLRFRSGGKPCTASNRARRICRGARPTPINMITAACSSSAAASAIPARRRCAPARPCAAAPGWCPSACRRRSMPSPP